MKCKTYKEGCKLEKSKSGWASDWNEFRDNLHA